MSCIGLEMVLSVTVSKFLNANIKDRHYKVSLKKSEKQKNVCDN